MKTIVIIGATGTIGTYTALDLKQKKYNVVACGKRISDNGFFKQHDIPYYSIDVENKDSFKSLSQIKNIDTVIHLAGIMPSTMSGYNPSKYIDSVLKGTLNVLNFCVDNKISKIIFSQSRADSNYLMSSGPIPSDIIKKFPLTGDHSVYSICKNAAVDLIEHYYAEFGLKRFILRLPTIYAYRPNPYYHVNGVKKWMGYRLIIDKAIKGETVEIWGDSSKSKEIVYIKDATQVIEKCIQSPLDGGMYNVGRGVGVTLEEQIKGIVNIFSPHNNKSEIVYMPDKPNGREYVNDISKTSKELGYIPQYDYESLLIDFKKNMEEEPFSLLWGKADDYK